MQLRELTLVNFRNYVRLAFVPGERVSILCGDNGQGKSNILEAVYFLATTRSARAGSDRELVHWRARNDTIPFARVEARIARAEVDLHIEVLIRADPDGDGVAPSRAAAPPNGAVPAAPRVTKKITVNGLPTRAVELVGQVNVVIFSPEDVALVAGPPAGRRRYLDITNSQVSGAYLRTLQHYNRVLEQRNHLLRQVRERRQPRDALDFWSAELATSGAQVVHRRLHTLASVNRELAPLYRQLSGSEQTLELIYVPTGHQPIENPVGPEIDQASLFAMFQARLNEVLPREIEQGVSIIGPHRDDFAYLLDGVNLNTYGSRGQQRLAVLALKLAEGQFMAAETAEPPILLLDDVLSELDPARRGFVLDQAGREGQTIITTTDLSDFPESLLEEAAVFSVDRGALSSAGYNPAMRGQGGAR